MSKDDKISKTAKEKTEDILDKEKIQDSEEIKEQNSQDDSNERNADKNPEDEVSTKQSQSANEEDTEGFQEKYMRLMADFQNYKKRVEKEKSDIFAFANEKIILDILNVLDNFERAILQGSSDDKFLEGMNMVLKQQNQVLINAGVEEIKSNGEEFDPNMHNAIMMEESGDIESGKITETLQKGYLLKGKVLRPSMVKVKK